MSVLDLCSVAIIVIILGLVIRIVAYAKRDY